MTARLRSVSVLQVGTFLAFVYAVFGFLIGLFWSTILSVIPFGLLHGLGAAALIYFPIFYGVFGFVTGVVGAGLYNLFALITGGVRFTLDAPPPREPITTGTLPVPRG